MFTIHAVKDTGLWIKMELGGDVGSIVTNVLSDRPDVKDKVLAHKSDPRLRQEIDKVLSTLQRDIDLAANKLDSYTMFTEAVDKLRTVFLNYVGVSEE